jgi:hypothetical protein
LSVRRGSMAGSTVKDEAPGAGVVVVGRGGAVVVVGTVVVVLCAAALLTAPQPVKPSKKATRPSEANIQLRTAPTAHIVSSPGPPIVRGPRLVGQSTAAYQIEGR